MIDKVITGVGWLGIGVAIGIVVLVVGAEARLWWYRRQQRRDQ